MKKINLMYLIGSLASGGAQRQLVELAKNIDKERYQVFIVVYRDQIHYDYIKSEDLKIVFIEKKHKISPLFLWRLVSFIRKNRIHIIHSYMHNTNVWGRLAGRISGCKTIISSIRTTELPKRYYSIEKLLSKWTATVITNSHAARNEYLKHMSIHSDSFIKVIPNGIDIDALAHLNFATPEHIRTRHKIKPEDFVIVHMAGIMRNKDQLCLLRAIEKIGNEGLKVRVGKVVESA